MISVIGMLGVGRGRPLRVHGIQNVPCVTLPDRVERSAIVRAKVDEHSPRRANSGREFAVDGCPGLRG